jgi:hypothetical protein
MNHSNQVRRFEFSPLGIELLEPVGKGAWAAEAPAAQVKAQA